MGRFGEKLFHGLDTRKLGAHYQSDVDKSGQGLVAF